MDRPQFSEMLAERRRQLGYSINQAARVLRLREDVLVAFEEGDLDALPKSGYAQGMLSSYARYLGLDAAEVIEAYQADLRAYRRETRRGSSRHRDGDGSAPIRTQRQPRVPSRGLLPTSGGYAGDMGSYATTRVRTRSSENTSEPDEEAYSYPQGRPYTGRVPSSATQSRSHDGRRGSDDIGTLQLDYSQYDDDLRARGSAQPYAAASSQRGRRRSTSQRGQSDRPRVNRRSSSQANDRNRRRSNRDNRSDGATPSVLRNPSNMLIFIVVAVIILTVILFISVRSCVSQNVDTRTVPVSTSTETTSQTTTQDTSATDSKQTTTKEQTTTTQPTTPDATQDTTATTDQSTAKSTSVSVSVSEGGVTWLEINCDGNSEIAQTVTGPWQKTFVVTDLLTVQAGDTTVVSVVQNGRQLQFDSMTSGIGTIRIQGPQHNAAKSTDPASTVDHSTDTSGSAKMGNASNEENNTEDNADGSQGQDQQDDTYGYDESYDSGNDYGYNEYDYNYQY